MAGKSKQQKKRRAKMQKQVNEGLKQKPKKKVVADQPTNVLGNNGEPPPANVNEDAGKDASMVAMAEAADIGLKRVEEMDIEAPFDPKSLIADILKKRGA